MPEKIDSSREDGSYLHSPTFSQYNDNNQVCHRPGQFDIHTGGGICDLSYVDSTLWSNNDKPLTRTHLDPPPTQAGLEDLNSSLDRPYNRGYLIDSPLADGNHQLSLSSVPLVITRTHSNTRKESFGPVTPYHQCREIHCDSTLPIYHNFVRQSRECGANSDGIKVVADSMHVVFERDLADTDPESFKLHAPATILDPGNLVVLGTSQLHRLSREAFAANSSFSFEESGGLQSARLGASQHHQIDEIGTISSPGPPWSCKGPEPGAMGDDPLLSMTRGAPPRTGPPNPKGSAPSPLFILPLFRKQPPLHPISTSFISKIFVSLPLLPFLFMPLVYHLFSAELSRSAQQSEIAEYLCLSLRDDNAVAGVSTSITGSNILQNFDYEWQEYRTWLVDSWKKMSEVSTGLIGATTTMIMFTYANDKNVVTLTAALLGLCWLIASLFCAAILALYFGSKRNLNNGYFFVADIVRPTEHTSKAFFILSVPLVFLCFGTIDFIVALLSLIWHSHSPTSTVDQYSYPQTLTFVVMIIGAIFTAISVIVWTSMALLEYSRAARRRTENIYTQVVDSPSGSTRNDGFSIQNQGSTSNRFRMRPSSC